MAKFCNRNIKSNIKRVAQTGNGFKLTNIPQENNVNAEIINEDMNTYEKIQMANAILNSETTTPTYKRVKKDKGLIERTESSKIVLTEDNKELLND